MSPARPELFGKALASAADAISIDLEDAVVESRKSDARAAVAELLSSTEARTSTKAIIVRVNALATAHFSADVRAIASPSLALVNLPKVESASEIESAVASIDRAFVDAGLRPTLRVLANIESPKGLRNASAIAEHPRVAGLQLGYADLFGPFGIERRDPQHVYSAMFAVRMAAAEAGVFARLVWVDGEPRDIGRDFRSGGITGLHPTREGYLYISANTPHFWRALCEKVNLPELAADERYDSVRKRAQHAAEIIPKLHEALHERTALEWEAHFGDQVPCAAARSIEDIFDNEQVLAEEMVTTLNHSLVGKYRGLSRPIKFDRTPGPAPFAAPSFGEHTRLVLEGAGCSEAEIERLQKK